MDFENDNDDFTRTDTIRVSEKTNSNGNDIIEFSKRDVFRGVYFFIFLSLFIL